MGRMGTHIFQGHLDARHILSTENVKVNALNKCKYIHIYGLEDELLLRYKVFTNWFLDVQQLKPNLCKI